MAKLGAFFQRSFVKPWLNLSLNCTQVRFFLHIVYICVECRGNEFACPLINFLTRAHLPSSRGRLTSQPGEEVTCGDCWGIFVPRVGIYAGIWETAVIE
jgi:hypothetical protein